MRVLITNGDFLKSILVLRSVSKQKDIEAYVGAESRLAPAFFSKYCKHKVVLPNAKKNPDFFIKNLCKYVKDNKIDVLLPINTFETELILKNRNLFGNTVTIPFVSYDLFRKVNDKWIFQLILNDLKIKTPKTMNLKTLEELNEVEKVLSYPMVVKFRVSAGSERLKFVNNNIKKAYLEMVKLKEKSEDLPIIQEYVFGENYGAGAICFNGKVKSVFVYKSLREAKIRYGSSTSRISVYNEEIEKRVKNILESLNWHGVAHFDIIRKGEVYYFLEMNPRFWLSINLTIKSGLNYPYYLCAPNVKIPKSYMDGVVCKIAMSDALVYFKQIFRNKYPFYFWAYADDADWRDPLPLIPLFFKFLRGKLL